MEKLTYKDVIEITKERYSNNTKLRSIDEDGRCIYFHPNGNKCAVGHFINESKFKYVLNTEAISSILIDEVDYKFYLDESVQHLQNKLFWKDLQIFHDDKFNWNENGITKDGITMYNNLLNNYAKQDI
jgi:hypothetical protein